MLDFTLALPVWWLNGLLAVAYWLLEHLAEFAALLAGAAIALGVDPALQRQASDRPRRHGRGAVATASPNARYFTIFTLLVWLAVSLTSRFPIPLAGALLWWLGLLAALASPEERFNQLWWAKSGILAYAALVLALRLGLLSLAQVSPADWAGLVGSRAGAQLALESARGNVAAIGMLFVFVIYPLGYAGLLWNRILRNPKPLYNLGMGAGDVLRRLRTRE